MLGFIMLGTLLLFEIIFTVLTFMKKSNLRKEKSIARIVLFAVFLLLAITPVIDFGFQWYMLGLILAVQAILGILVLIRRKENTEIKNRKIIFTSINRIILLFMALVPVLIFPQHDPIKTSGEYSVGTISYTLTDEAREEYFTEEKDNRKVTIQFWYPSDTQGEEGKAAAGKFPLVIFSHGAFGYRMSNYSTLQELASNGYIVCSIDHTYHAFMTKQEDGKTVIANFDFINSAMGAQMGAIEPEKSYELEQEWMKLRTGDMAFVLKYIREKAASADADEVYKGMDLEHIGVFGHSLGGATAAKIGRDDKEVDAVIVVDGTMLGEATGIENGVELVTDVPYPKPIMNIYSEYHYNDAFAGKDTYPNMIVDRNAKESYQVVIMGSGHMNFTDLPIISPFLSSKLETGDRAITVDPRYCIETTNADILQFFNKYLKSSSIEIQKLRFQ